MIVYSLVSGYRYEGYTLHGVFFNRELANRMFDLHLSVMVSNQQMLDDSRNRISSSVGPDGSREAVMGTHELVLKPWDSEKELEKTYEDVFGDATPWENLDK